MWLLWVGRVLMHGGDTGLRMRLVWISVMDDKNG